MIRKSIAKVTSEPSQPNPASVTVIQTSPKVTIAKNETTTKTKTTRIPTSTIGFLDGKVEPIIFDNKVKEIIAKDPEVITRLDEMTDIDASDNIVDLDVVEEVEKETPPDTPIESTPNYFDVASIFDRQSNIDFGEGSDYTFSFDYLSYLIFNIDISQPLNSFYEAVQTIINSRKFEREEDTPDTPLDDSEILDTETIHTIFYNIWEVAKTTNNSIKNLIGFYIYFNRKLNFLPILIQGTTMSEFFKELTLESILVKLSTLGLYPISGWNLFERLWNSYTYSVQENSNRAETKLSLKEYYNTFSSKIMGETHRGFVNKNDELIILYDIDMGSWNNKKTFRNETNSFNRLKEIIEDYLPRANMKKYLLNILPTEDSIVYLDKTLVSPSNNINAPHRELWLLLQSFDTIFRINRMNINKDFMRNMFIDFSKSVAFPTGSTEANDYNLLWIAWVQYINFQASEITTRLSDATDTDHDYSTMVNDLIWLVNAKFILRYLQNNNTFRNESEYTDGTSYVDSAISKVYGSLKELKKQLKDVIKYITRADKRFYPSYIK